MRKSTLKKEALALFIAACGFCIPAQAQEFSEELILQSPGVHAERNLGSIVSELETLGGITYVGFCQNQNVILLRVNRKIQPNDKPILEAFTQKLLEIHVKTGTFTEVIAACPSMTLQSSDPVNDTQSGSGSPD